MRYRMSLSVVLCFSVVHASIADGAGILIPVTDRHDIVFDGTRDLLYITTNGGLVQRYDVVSKSLLAPFNVGVDLSGADLTTNGSFLYVGEETAGATQGIVRKVDLTAGTHTNIFYNLDGLEGGVWDIVIMSNGKGLVTTKFNGSGAVALRSLDLSNDTLNKIPNPANPSQTFGVMQNTNLSRSFDRNLAFLAQSNISSGPILVYDATNNTFPASADTGWSLSSSVSAVNRNGTQIALSAFGFGFSLLNANLSLLDVLPAYRGGVAYSPVTDVVYAADAGHDQIVAYNSLTSAELYRLDVGEDIGDTGAFPPLQMTVSNNGQLLFLTTPQGVRMFSVAVPEPATSSLALCLLALVIYRGRWQMIEGKRGTLLLTGK